MKILILGKKGWLGSRFYDYLVGEGVEVTDHLPSDDAGSFNHNPRGDINLIDRLDDDITAVVNFAASADIDWCEKNKNKAFWNNVLGAINVAKVCKEKGIKHVFVSSACVLRSRDGYDIRFEDSEPAPACFYARTKLMAEELISEIDPNSLIVRLRLPISAVPHPRNALNKLSGYKKLINSQESVTVVEDFLARLLVLIKKDEKGPFNLVNEGTISPAEIGKLIGHEFETITKNELDEHMDSEGRAKRVSTIVGTHKGYLPPINDRVSDIINKWKSMKK